MHPVHAHGVITVPCASSSGCCRACAHTGSALTRSPRRSFTTTAAAAPVLVTAKDMPRLRRKTATRQQGVPSRSAEAERNFASCPGGKTGHFFVSDHTKRGTMGEEGELDEPAAAGHGGRGAAASHR